MKYRIEHDEDAESPRAWSGAALFIVANHPQFYVPPPGEDRIPKCRDPLIEQYGKTHWIFNIEAYIHGGVVLAMSDEGDFPDRRWDVSQLGMVFVRKDEWPDESDAKKAALSHLNTWNQYLSGDVWGYVIEDDDGNEVDACWGFYGKECCEERAKAVADSWRE